MAIGCANLRSGFAVVATRVNCLIPGESWGTVNPMLSLPLLPQP